jgi:hypothetical protein
MTTLPLLVCIQPYSRLCEQVKSVQDEKTFSVPLDGDIMSYWKRK